jgi:hypothetical protein
MSLRSGRSTTIRPKPNKKEGKRKKKCDLGSACPYKDEYQHLTEFSHDTDDRGHDASVTAVPGFRPFAGAGHIMPTSTIAKNGSVADAVMQRSAAAIAVRPPSRQEETIDLCHDNDTSVPSYPRKQASAQQIPKSTVSSKANAANLNSVIDLCDDDSGDDATGLHQPIASRKPVAKRPRVNREVLSPSWAVAVSEEDEQRQLARAMAASNREVVLDQDAEYYESLRKDQAKERAKRDEEVRIREEDDLRRAMEESARLAEEETERSALREFLDHQKQLEPEPPEGPNTATIAFRLPSECSIPRLVRRFPVSACADQLISYLKSRVELAAIPKWTLRKVVGGTEILQSTALKDLGLAPRGIVVVRNEVD